MRCSLAFWLLGGKVLELPACIPREKLGDVPGRKAGQDARMMLSNI
jgi:hypothetical protein